MIKNIIFDFGGVLLDLDPVRCKQQFAAIGYTQIYDELGTAHHNGVLGRMEDGGVTARELCDAIRDGVRHSNPDMPMPTDRQVIAAFCSMADGIPSYRLDFVNELREEGYRVDALSNTNPIHWGFCMRYFIECGYVPSELFGHIWLSCDMHMSKPDPEIFRAVLRESGYEPDETVFVDDNETNCRVAQSLGIHTYCPPVRTDWREEFRTFLLT
ncbi:MAG: HAD family phosphatase [Bacteroidales bacterium]|nr:HAD family phosphatase [Candidatus Liminaster caballi]